MGIFSNFRKQKDFFTLEERTSIVEAIRANERLTSGEIRVYLESKNRFVDPLDRAAEIFYKLQMDETEKRNAVLIYIATKHNELAIFGDEGIHREVGKDYWKDAVLLMLKEVAHEHLATGVINCINKVGETLKIKFPYEATTDKNELPDDIVFGK